MQESPDPTGDFEAGFTVGGLSGIDYNPTTQTFISESDHGTNGQPTHYYTLFANWDPRSPSYWMTINGSVVLGPDDIESIRYDPTGNGVVYTTEGSPPAIYHLQADGTTVREPVPNNIATRAQVNSSFEGSTFTPNGTYYVSMENALFGDANDLTRITKFNSDGSVAAQYVYKLDNVIAVNNGNQVIANPPGGGIPNSNNGVSDIIALSDTSFLVMERAWDALGATTNPSDVSHNSIRIYKVDITGAPDVQNVQNLVDGTNPAMTKTLVWDSASIASQTDSYFFKVDNIEGMSFGPKMADGHDSMVLVSDNNYSNSQAKTQFLTMEVGTPIPTTQYWDGTGAMADSVVGGGSGIWSANSASENWARSGGLVNDAWAGPTAVFDHAPGTVTIDTSAGTVSAKELDFLVDGYRLVGGPLTMNSSGLAISVAGAARTAVAAPLVGQGSVTVSGPGTLALSGASTYAGGTVITSGVLDLAGTTAVNGTVITSGAAGTGGISFGATASATLKIETSAFNAHGSFGYAVTGFSAGDAIDLTNLSPTGLTSAYAGGQLTVTNGSINDTLSVNDAPAGYQFGLVSDKAGGTDVVLVPMTSDSGGGSNTFSNPSLGSDVLSGTTGSDTIAGLTGDDTILGGSGNSLLFGNQGNDVITAGDGNNTVAGGQGDDQITVGNGPNLLYGDEGADTIAAGDGNNTILGGTGNGAIDSNDGADSITVGSGNDLILGNGGDDTIALGGGADTALGGQGNDLISATGAGNDLLYGNEGADTIEAGNGNNTLVGGSGNSLIDSLDGADLITSGTGNDLIFGNGGDDTVASGGGSDTVVGGFGRDVILGNQGDDILLGNQGDDTILGGQGADTVVGGQGNDVLYGNEGDDVLYGNEGLNTFVFNPGDTDFKSGVSTGDKVMDFVTGTSRIDFASGPAGTASNFGTAQTTSTDFAAIQLLGQQLINGGDTYAFVADGTDGFLFTTGGTGTAITDAVKLVGAGTATSVKYQDIAHGALA